MRLPSELKCDFIEKVKMTSLYYQGKDCVPENYFSVFEIGNAASLFFLLLYRNLVFILFLTKWYK
jgi:hypothetical protein